MKTCCRYTWQTTSLILFEPLLGSMIQDVDADVVALAKLHNVRVVCYDNGVYMLITPQAQPGDLAAMYHAAGKSQTESLDADAPTFVVEGK